MKGRVILAGGSGFLGRSLTALLISEGYEVVVLTRAASPDHGSVRYLQWDGRTLGDWASSLDGAKAVVNLAGKSVNCRYTSANRQEIIGSRVESVRVLGEAIRKCNQAPEAFVQAGSLAIYGDAGDRWCDEQSARGDDWSVEVCRQWEEALDKIEFRGMRKTLLRIGFALGRNGGALQMLARLTRWFLGGAVGGGGQYISWIHIDDLNRMFLWAIERENITGIFNATSPRPVTNAQFMRELRRSLHRPWSPPVPAWAAQVGSWLMRTEASLALTGRRCTPKHFLEKGFTFEFGDLRTALENLYPAR